MPRIAVHGADIHYEERGAGPEAVVFAHGLLWSGGGRVKLVSSS
jgi:3-oxoadipate enol-lactonase